MRELQICKIGATKLNTVTNQLVAQCKGESEFDEYESSMYGQLGVIARPYPADDSASAESIIYPTRNAILATRDVRCAPVVGNLQPGDTVLFSCGPDQNARIFCKEDKRIIALLVKDSDEKDMGIIIDGLNKKIQVMISGSVMFELSADHIISSFTKNGQSSAFEQTESNIKVQAGNVSLGAGPIYLQGAVGTIGPANQVSPSVSLSIT